MEAMEMTTEAPPLLDECLFDIPTQRLTGSIYVPLIFNRKVPLHILVMQTHGRGLRYFESVNDPILRDFRRSYSPEIKLGDTIKLGELTSWMLTYSITMIPDLYYVSNHPNVNCIPITKLDDLFCLNMPMELREAILQVAVKAG